MTVRTDGRKTRRTDNGHVPLSALLMLRQAKNPTVLPKAGLHDYTITDIASLVTFQPCQWQVATPLLRRKVGDGFATLGNSIGELTFSQEQTFHLSSKPTNQLCTKLFNLLPPPVGFWINLRELLLRCLLPKCSLFSTLSSQSGVENVL